MSLSRVVPLLQKGGIVVIPTDTIYGIIAKAFDRTAVKRLFAFRRASPRKPFVILIDSVSRLKEFGITLNAAQRRFLRDVWPGKVSVVLSCPIKEFAYLHCGRKTLAFRLPNTKGLRTLLKKTGPLVAPSANPEGMRPAETAAAARRYFGARVDAYVGAGRMSGKPSTLVSFTGASPKVLREGAVSLPSRFLPHPD